MGHSVGFGMALVYLLAALAALLVGTTTVRTLHRFCFKRLEIFPGYLVMPFFIDVNPEVIHRCEGAWIRVPPEVMLSFIVLLWVCTITS